MDTQNSKANKTIKPRFSGRKSGTTLKDSCVLIMGQSPSSNSYNTSGDGLPFYQGNADFGEENPVPRSWCTEPKKIAEKGDILISVRAPIGAINIANEKCCIGRGVAAIRPNQEVMSPDFLQHQLFASRNKLEAMGTGSTFKAVGKKTLSDFPVVIYPKNTQEAIAQQLNSIKKQIKTANSQLDQLDALVKSRFIEMFGDPVANTMEWKTSPVDEICPQCSSKTPTVGQVWQLGLEMIEPDSGRVTSKTIVDARSLKSSNTGFSSSHVLYSKLRPYLNKVVLPDDDGVCTTELVPLLPKHDVLERTYLCYLLRSKPFVDYISKQVAGAKMPRVDMKKFKAFQVPVPPFNFQQEFAAFVAQVDKLRFKTQQQIEKLEMLKKSLMQDYFG